MVDTARQLLDELMGRNRNLDPTTAKGRKINWDDPEFCLYFLVKFCPHDLFVNTRADLGQCSKVHDEEAKRLYDEARPSVRKRHYEDEFLRFSNHMLNEVDRKITKGKQRLLLMNKGEPGGTQVVYVSKFQEQINNLNARIKKLIGEAEEAGNRGDVDQAQGLMTLCDQLKDEKDNLVKQHDNAAAGSGSGGTTPQQGSTTPANGSTSAASVLAGGGNEVKSSTSEIAAVGSGGSGSGSTTGGGGGGGVGNKWQDFQSSEKQMEVCEVCGAFLIVGDAQQRLEDHLTGKQHMGYSRLRKAVDEMYQKRKQEREEEEKAKEEERKHKLENGIRDRRSDSRGYRGGRDDFDDRRRRGGGGGGYDDRDRRGGGGGDYHRRQSSDRDRDRDRGGDRDRRGGGSDHYRHRRDDRDYRNRGDRGDRGDRRRSRSRH